MTNTEKISEDVEKILKGFDGMIGSKQKLKDLFSTSITQAIAEERERLRENLPKIITPTVEPSPNNLSQNQIFASGQMNMLLRVTDLLSSLDTPLTDKE